MGRAMTGSTNGYGRPCIKIRVAADREVSIAFRSDETPENVVIFEPDADGDFVKNITDSVLEEESGGAGEVRIDDFDDLLRIVDLFTPAQPVEEVDFGAAKRALIALGHKFALAEDAFYRDRKPAQAFKAKKAKLSVIDAIVEVCHILDGNIENIKV